MVIIDDARLLGDGVESLISTWFFGGRLIIWIGNKVKRIYERVTNEYPALSWRIR